MSSVNIKFSRDAGEYDAWYEPTAVIEFRGSLRSTGESQGHYICDLKDKMSNLWFRTNDNCDPIPISNEDVSQYGYVVLFKRK